LAAAMIGLVLWLTLGGSQPADKQPADPAGEEKLSVDQLMEELKQQDPPAQIKAAKALGKKGAAARRAKGALGRLLKSTHAGVRQAAADALNQVHARGPL